MTDTDAKPATDVTNVACCPRCGLRRRLQGEAGLCAPCSRTCVDCGAVVRPRQRDRCSRCHRRAEASRACHACGEVRLLVGLGLCEPCWQRDPDRPFRQAARLAARLTDPPSWLLDFVAHTAARHCVGRTCLMVGSLGRLIVETSTTNPQSLLERARRPGRSMGTLARTLEEFFVGAGLAFPLDQAARLAAGRRQRRVQGAPEPLRPALARFADVLVTGQQRAIRAGTRPRTDRTIEDDLAIVRDLARFLVSERAKQDWASAEEGDVDVFLAERPLSRARRLGALRGFFRWARANRVVLVDPTRDLTTGRHRGFRGHTLGAVEQRRLFRRWTTDPDAHPNECLFGLLSLLHAASSAELRGLKVSDIDAVSRTIKLGERRHRVPLDPASWKALQRCLEHRDHLGTHNTHVIVTQITKTRSTPASDQYMVRVLDPSGIRSRTLRATRIIDLVASLDPKLVCEALAMEPTTVLPYMADQVQDARLANL